jgi:hypothetical protein
MKKIWNKLVAESMKFTTAQLEAFIDAMLVLENDIARINNEIALNRLFA